MKQKRSDTRIEEFELVALGVLLGGEENPFDAAIGLDTSGKIKPLLLLKGEIALIDGVQTLFQPLLNPFDWLQSCSQPEKEFSDNPILMTEKAFQCFVDIYGKGCTATELKKYRLDLCKASKKSGLLKKNGKKARELYPENFIEHKRQGKSYLH